MGPRSLVILVVIAVAAVVGVIAALLGMTDVTLAVVVLLLAGTAALALQVFRSTGAAAAGARDAGREIQRLRSELARHDKRSATDVSKVRREVSRTRKTVENHHSAAMADHSQDTAQRLADSSAALGGLGSELKDLGKTVSAVRSMVYAARPGKLLTQVQALQQLRDKFHVTGPLPDVGGWALDPTELLWLVDEIERRRPECVVECGSGTSTFWIALALQMNGHGRVVSVDHLEEFADRTRSVLDRHGLSDVAEVLHAPLVDTVTAHGSMSWYDFDTTGIESIDLLVVDGPPASTGPLARYPALPVLHHALTPGACVLVDDVHRSDEREAIDHWLEELPGLRRAGYSNGNSEVLLYG